ncbi:MAG: YopX family protein [Treponema sp.]|jgi:uncharacterized phage protein (TIGR01671 family)|nr:YopX family protein [Treponema sp.]
MREILFRAKRSDANEWVEGCICRDRSWMMVSHNPRRNYHINPETVGQYTGLTDKNGVRIFEGDIVKTNKGGNWSTIREVRWVNALCGFSPFYAINTEYEVIGNIHDTPELLGRE